MSSFLNRTVNFGANLSWLAPLAIQCDTIDQSDFDDQYYSEQDTDREFPNNYSLSLDEENKSNYNTVYPNDLLSSKDKGSAGKKKVAPRSGLQFKLGPGFECTDLFKLIFTETTNQKVFPFLNARIDRGFDFVNGEWIGYKRNYFTLVAAFEFDGFDSSIFTKEKFYTYDNNNRKVSINYFALRLVSKCCEDDVPVSLVQHTAKRDRGPQFSPPVYPAISGILPSHYLIKLSANIRNETKIDQFNKLFFFNGKDGEKPLTSILSTYPEGVITTVARYERIQFSTSINQRKPSMVNRHFILLVELLGYVNEDKFFVMAATETPPLIIRGRSPSNYQINRANSKTPQFKSKSDFMNSRAGLENLDPGIQVPRGNFDHTTIQSYPIERRTNKIASIEGKDIISDVSDTKQLLKKLKKRAKAKYKKACKKQLCDYRIPMSSESPETPEILQDEDDQMNLEIDEHELENLKRINLVSNEKYSDEVKLRNIDENYDTDEEICDSDLVIPKTIGHSGEGSKGFQILTNYSDNIPTSPYINNSIDSYDASALFNNSENIDPYSTSLNNDTTKYGFTLETNYHTCAFDEPTIMVAKSKKKIKSNHSSKKRRKVTYVSSYSTYIDTETFDILEDMLDSEIRYSQSSYISEFLT